MIELFIFGLSAALLVTSGFAWYYHEQVRQLRGYINRLEKHVDGEIMKEFERR